MKKLLILGAAVAGAVSIISRRKRGAEADSALWSEAVKSPSAG